MMFDRWKDLKNFLIHIDGIDSEVFTSKVSGNANQYDEIYKNSHRDLVMKEFAFRNVKEPRFARNLFKNYHFYEALYKTFIEN